MTGKITSALAVLVFLLGVMTGMPGVRIGNAQGGLVDEDTRKKPGFDPTQFPGEDLSPLLNGQKFSNGKHTLKPFADGTRLSIETKNGKIRRATLVDVDRSKSAATIHSPEGPPTARRFTVGVHLGVGSLERCYICTFGRDSQQQQSAGANARERRRLVKCYTAPCDDFYPEPEPPPIDPLKKSTG
jgi:hypothetical protein